MAEAIAIDAIARAGERPGAAVNVFSAGLGAAEGAPAAEESVAALRKLGIEPPIHHSITLTPEMVAKADLIYTMTAAHAARVLELDPGARGKVFTLDPQGRDIPDPIGSPQAVYDLTAQELRRLINARVQEILA